MRKAKKGSAALEVHEPVRVKIEDINPAPYNPRIMPDAMMRALKASMVKHGLVLNFVVQKKSAKYGAQVMIGGHQRLRAAREMCAERGWALPEFGWAVMLDVSDAVAFQLNVSLNKVEGEFDAYKLGKGFAEFMGGMLPDDFVAVGFELPQVEELVALTLPPEDMAALLEGEAVIPEFARSVSLTLEFETVKARDELKEILAKRSKAEGAAKVGDLVLKVFKSRL